MRYNLWIVALATTSIFVSGKSAWAEFDSRRLFSRGSWYVDLARDTDDNSYWCSAETTNGARQSFSITAFDNRNAMLMIFDPTWNITARSVNFIVDVDYERWNISGHAEDKSVSVFLEGKGKASSFLEDLARGSAIAVYNEQLVRQASFSLRGSHDALLVLLKCWARIVSNDPFSRSADPF